jgi:hypothetical protein
MLPGPSPVGYCLPARFKKAEEMDGSEEVTQSFVLTPIPEIKLQPLPFFKSLHKQVRVELPLGFKIGRGSFSPLLQKSPPCPSLSISLSASDSNSNS